MIRKAILFTKCTSIATIVIAATTQHPFSASLIKPCLSVLLILYIMKDAWNIIAHANQINNDYNTNQDEE